MLQKGWGWGFSAAAAAKLSTAVIFDLGHVAKTHILSNVKYTPSTQL